MKKLITIIMAIFVLTAFTACKSDENNSKSNNTKNEVVWTEKESDNGIVITYEEIPETAECLGNTVDFKDEYSVASGLIVALTTYEYNPRVALEMMELLNGPDDLSAYDENFIKEQFSQYPYIARSYYYGATPENNYTPESFELEFTENIYSRNEEGYVVLWIKSGGADNAREIKLRKKQSTGEWFVVNYPGILAGIKVPSENNKWA